MTGNYDSYYADWDFSPLTTDEFHHFVGVWDGTNLVYYIDGAYATAVPLDSTAFPDGVSNQVIIGGNNFYNGDFNGSIDEVMIYDRALSAEEVGEIYNV